MLTKLLFLLFSLSWSSPYQTRIPGFGGTYSAGAWAHEYTVTLGGSDQIPATQTNFPILVCANVVLGNGNACGTVTGLKGTASGGLVTSASGFDIAFSSAVCSAPSFLNWELVNYNPSTGAMEAWVQVPTLSAGAVLYLCVGNAAVSTFQGGSTGKAWANNYQGVWHLPNGSVLSSADSTTYGDNGTNTAVVAAPGMIGGGAGFNGSSSQIDVGSSSILKPVTAMTISMWIDATSFPVGYSTFYSSIESSFPYGNILRVNTAVGGCSGGGKNGIEFIVGTAAGGCVGAQPVDPPSAGVWHLIAGTYDGATISVYTDGSQVATASQTGNLLQAAGSTLFGADPTAAGRVFAGAMDEIRISSVARSPQWLKTEFNNQSTPAAFMNLVLTF